MNSTQTSSSLFAKSLNWSLDELMKRSLRLIIADLVRQIFESKIVIAEITPANANVYYEVGFAHAMNKPTILFADRGTKLDGFSQTSS